MAADLASAKRALRRLLRNQAEPAPGALGQLRAGLLGITEGLPSSVSIAGVWPLPGEPDLVPVWEALRRRGHPVLLPETTPKGEPLRFREWDETRVLVPGRFGTRHPDGPERVPDVVFLPVLAFDERLFRLGYGGGYYDRTLAELPRAVAVGFGWSDRLVRGGLPVEPFDIPLAAVVTERGLVLPEGAADADPFPWRRGGAQRP